MYEIFGLFRNSQIIADKCIKNIKKRSHKRKNLQNMQKENRSMGSTEEV